MSAVAGYDAYCIQRIHKELSEGEEETSGETEAEHISYKYPGGSREVLSDVSLELGSTDRLGDCRAERLW